MRSMAMGILATGSLLLLCACDEPDQVINPEPVSGKLVFVTSKTYTGDLGGIGGADDKCQQLAEAAGLPGTYRAWLADDYDSPAARFHRSTDPYLRVDGVRVADDWTDLTDGALLEAIARDETGAAPAEWRVWTNVRPDGTQFGSSYRYCWRWTANALSTTGSIGISNATGTEWTLKSSNNSPRCSEKMGLYCFEQ